MRSAEWGSISKLPPQPKQYRKYYFQYICDMYLSTRISHLLH